MEFSFKDYSRLLGELTVKDYNCNITTDVVGSLGNIDHNLIENMTDVTIEMVKFNGNCLVEHFYELALRHLNDGQMQELSEMLNPSQEDE